MNVDIRKLAPRTASAVSGLHGLVGCQGDLRRWLTGEGTGTWDCPVPGARCSTSPPRPPGRREAPGPGDVAPRHRPRQTI